jgi:antitoxin MazE
MQVAKWGNSLAIRIPASVVETLKLKEGDNVEIYVEGTRSFGIRKSADTRELLERVRKLRGRMPEGFKFDRLEANERKP